MLSTTNQLVIWSPTTYYVFSLVESLAAPKIFRENISSNNSIAKKYPLKEVIEQIDGLRQDITVFECNRSPFSAVLGTNFSPEAAIYIDHELMKIEPGAAIFLCRRLALNIRYNEHFNTPGLAALASTVGAVALPYLQPGMPWWTVPAVNCIPILTGYCTKKIANMVWRKISLDCAFSSSTPAELKGLKRLLEAKINVNKRFHKIEPKNFLADGNTNFTFDYSLFPRAKDAVEKINAIMKEKNIAIESTPASTELEGYFIDYYEKIHHLKLS